ncbi:MAG: hypothetical protein H6737_13275 [Alphaproteobacteria bacterium]|nr:hypothetical protein [Alphaproteobacteria bacterium]
MEPTLAGLLEVGRHLAENAEVVSGLAGSTSGIGGGLLTHWWQLRKSRVLPTLPSHAEALAREGDEATRFFSAVHELTMTVTEAWNAVRARRSGGRVEEVVKRDVITRCRDDIVGAAAQLRGRLEDYALCAGDVDEPRDVLRGVWTYRNHHNYRTETYTVTTTDSKGKSRTETRTRQVYVNTDHWFDFDRTRAEKAERHIRAFLGDWAKVDFQPLHVHGHEVVIAKLTPAERSFLERLVRNTVLEDPEAEVSEADLHHWANQWLLGTRIDASLRAFEENLASMDAHVGTVFRVMYESDAHYHFRTTYKSHSGPPGFQQHASAVAWLAGISAAWGAVDRMIDTCVASAEKLVAFASDPSVIESDREYAQVAIEAYEAAFPDSAIEVDQLASYGWSVALGVLAAAVSGALTWLVHPMGYGIW